MAKKITKPTVRKLAKEIREFLLRNDMWVDTTIYFNGMAYATDDRNGHYYYNDREQLVELQDQDPHLVCNWVGPYLTMTFEGDFYDVMNDYLGKYGYRLQEEFRQLVGKYGLYYELGNAWNLSLYEI